MNKLVNCHYDFFLLRTTLLGRSCSLKAFPTGSHSIEATFFKFSDKPKIQSAVATYPKDTVGEPFSIAAKVILEIRKFDS